LAQCLEICMNAQWLGKWLNARSYGCVHLAISLLSASA
jgi:hypothetical protein